MTTGAHRTKPPMADHQPRTLPRVDELRPAFHVSQPVAGLFHWTAIHRDIDQEVHSYYFAGSPAVVIDPMMPPDGVDWLRHRPPAHILLTNRLHFRDTSALAELFHAQVWAHEKALSEFPPEEHVRGFRHGDELPGGIMALEVGALTPEETAFHLPLRGGALSLGDALIRDGNHELSLVPDEWMGDDPATVRQGLFDAFRRLLQQPFEHLLLAHGEPCIGDGKAALRRFVEHR